MAQKFTVPITVKQLTSAGSDAITVYVDQDTYARLKLEAGGRLTWGPGASAGDVNLYRDAADVLKTDDTFKAAALFVDGIEIDPTGATTDQVLKFDGTKFVPGTDGGGGGGATTLDELTDVTAPSPSSGDFLKWDGAAWVNDAIDLGTDTTGNYVSNIVAGTGITVDFTPGEDASASVSLNATFSNLSDVSIIDPENYQTLVYDGTEWINEYPTTVSLVENAEATTLQVGEAVYLFGGTGNHATVKRADNDGDATSAKTVGLVARAIPAGGNGPVVTRGYVTGMDLSSGYTAGQTLYLGENGGYTTTKPHAPEHLVYLGVVVRATNNGIIYVAAQNGYELDEIHDVDLVTTPPVSGDFLKYNGTLWVNDAINLGTDTVGNYLSSISAGTGISVNFTPGEDTGASVSLNATLNDLSDVTTTGASAGNVLTFDGSIWTAASAGGGGGASVTVSDTPPAGAAEGDLWFESDTTRTYVYYDSFWIEIGSTGAGATTSDTAPTNPVQGQFWFNSLNGATYVYYGTVWLEVGAVPVNTLLSTIQAKGDLLVGTAAATVDNLGVGNDGDVLTADSSTATGLKWAPSTGGGGGLNTSTDGVFITMAIGF